MKIPNDPQVFPTSAQLRMNVFDNEPIDAANSFSPEDVMAQEPEEDVVIVVQNDVEILEDVNYDVIDIATSLDDLEEQILFEDSDNYCSPVYRESDLSEENIDPVPSFNDMEDIISEESIYPVPSFNDMEDIISEESIDPVPSFDDMEDIIDCDLI